MAKKSVTKKTVVTELLTRKNKSPSRCNEYEYVEDEWERTPKTGYTYAQSGSYSKAFFSKTYVSPNMARRSLRTGGSCLSSNTTQYDHEEDMATRSVSFDSSVDSISDVGEETIEENVNQNARNRKHTQNVQWEDVTTQTSSTALSKNTAAHGERSYIGNVTIQYEPSPDLDALRRTMSEEEWIEYQRVQNTRGVLRSGTKYGPKWRYVGHRVSPQRKTATPAVLPTSSHKRSHKSTRIDSENMQYVQKNTTASEEFEETEEKVLHSPLYGLDHADAHTDDSEVDDIISTQQSTSMRSFVTARSSRSSEHSSSFFEGITNTFISVVSWPLYPVWLVITLLLAILKTVISLFLLPLSHVGSAFYRYIVDHVQNESWVLLSTSAINGTSSESESSVINDRSRIERQVRKDKGGGICCCSPIPCLLFMLPLLLLAPHIAKEHELIDGNTFTSLAEMPLFAYFTNMGQSGSMRNETVMLECPPNTDLRKGYSISDQQLEDKIVAVLASYFRDKGSDIAAQQSEFHQHITNEHNEKFNQHKVDLEILLKNILMNEMDVFKNKLSDTETKAISAAKVQAAKAAKAESKLAVDKTIADLQLKLERGESNIKLNEKERQELLTALTSRVDNVEKSVSHLRNDHSNQQAALDKIRIQLHTTVMKTDQVTRELAQARSELQASDGVVREQNALLIGQLQAQLDNLQLEVKRLRTAHDEIDAAVKLQRGDEAKLIDLIKENVKEQINAMMYGESKKSADGMGGIFGGMFGGLGKNKNDGAGTGFAIWLQEQLNSKDSVIDSKITSLAIDMEKKIAGLKKENGEAFAAMAASATKVPNCTVCNTTQTVIVKKQCCDSNDGGAFAGIPLGGLQEDKIKGIVHDALLIYGADKTGLVDYAQESGGGSIASIRCTETYNRKTAQLSLFGIPLWYISNSPRAAIQPDVNIGQCWAFKGQMGYLVVQLSTSVTPTAFTIEHIPKRLSPSGRIDSAPRDYTVLGLHEENDKHPISLGNYTYHDNGEPIQTVPVQAYNPGSFPFIELRILSNWGNIEYTCLYRFRVHGEPVHWP